MCRDSWDVIKEFFKTSNPDFQGQTSSNKYGCGYFTFASVYSIAIKVATIKHPYLGEAPSGCGYNEL